MAAVCYGPNFLLKYLIIRATDSSTKIPAAGASDPSSLLLGNDQSENENAAI